MARTKGTVGVVGLGIMGGAFAQNLCAAGWRVLGYDTDSKRRRLLQRAGVEIAKDAGDLAARAATIITSLPHAGALADTVAAITAAKLKPHVIVEMSTLALDDKFAAARALEKAGHIMLDCPVSGTGAQAKVKDIAVYSSGDSKTIGRLRPLFAGFARAMHDVGAFGNGSRMKYVANLLVAIHNVAAAEAMVLGMKSGLDPKLIFAMVTAGAGTSRVLKLRGPMMVKGRYDDPTMKVALWQKDMAVIGEFAQSLGCPTPLFSATAPLYDSAMASGHALHDTASVCAVLERMAGVKRRR
jgi:3-hydroxyisobutyrate dehydrogenase-like beta-hydroxyacid dehydrogenase